MNLEDILRNPTNIYELFDLEIKSSPLFSYPRVEAFLHSFRILEAMDNDIHRFANGLDGLFYSSQKYQDIRKYLIYWIYTKCPEGGRYAQTRESDLDAVKSAIILANSFSYIHDAIVGAQKGLIYLTLDEQSKIISFKYRDPAKGLQLLSKFEERIYYEAKALSKLENKLPETDPMIEAINQLTETVWITKDKELRYSTNEFINSAFEKYIKAALSIQYILHDSWSLGPYNISNFREVWIQLSKISHIHQIAFIDSQLKYGNYDPGYNCALYRMNKTALKIYLNKYTSLDESVISEILRDLTYSANIPHIDIIQQPLIEMVMNELFFSPSLILGSLVDRNLQVLLNKLPYRQDAYAKLKNLKEDLMISTIEPEVIKNNYRCKSNVSVKSSGKDITDIDLFIWDKNEKSFLIAELKWFYGADSAQEVFNHDNYFNDGIEKTKRSVEYVKENIKEIACACHISLVSHEINIYGIIVSRTGTPSPFVNDPYFPVVEVEQFQVLLREGNGDIQKLNSILNTYMEKKKQTISIKESSVQINVGDLRFALPAIEY